MTRRGALLAGLAAVGLLAAGCGGNRANLMFTAGNAWGVATHRDSVGKLWAAGSIPLCTRGTAPVKLTSISPVSVRGQIRLDRIAVRKVREWQNRGTYNQTTYVIGTYPGVPPGSHAPDGYLVQSDCRFRHATDPYYEIVVVAARTGATGGSIEGLRVQYSGGAYVIPFTFSLCGPRPGSGPCSPNGSPVGYLK